MRHPALLGPGVFLANKRPSRARDTPPYGQLSTANLYATESLEGSSARLVPCPYKRRMPCAYALCPSAPTEIDAASAPAVHIRTDFV
ncbi:hypothetical protein B0H14DRAFT_3887688 [Mycena olivaceomarginata]|nr:hypothetical protein B0H14DRAFT_3887688 [Mycena olivaceomarginata]